MASPLSLTQTSTSMGADKNVHRHNCQEKSNKVSFVPLKVEREELNPGSLDELKSCTINHQVLKHPSHVPLSR